MQFTSRSGSASTLAAAMALLALTPLAAADGMFSMPEPWITIDPNGASATITPTASTTKGSTTILSAPPSSLAQTSVYTLSVGGQASTTTGLAPAPTATGPGAAGAVFACQEYQGMDSPFCVPRRGSQLAPGKTYYSEWANEQPRPLPPPPVWMSASIA